MTLNGHFSRPAETDPYEVCKDYLSTPFPLAAIVFFATPFTWSLIQYVDNFSGISTISLKIFVASTIMCPRRWLIVGNSLGQIRKSQVIDPLHCLWWSWTGKVIQSCPKLPDVRQACVTKSRPHVRAHIIDSIWYLWKNVTFYDLGVSFKHCL